MIVLATYCLNILHPGYLLSDVIEEERRAKKEDGRREEGSYVGKYASCFSSCSGSCKIIYIDRRKREVGRLHILCLKLTPNARVLTEWGIL